MLLFCNPVEIYVSESESESESENPRAWANAEFREMEGRGGGGGAANAQAWDRTLPCEPPFHQQNLDGNLLAQTLSDVYEYERGHLVLSSLAQRR